MKKKVPFTIIAGALAAAAVVAPISSLAAAPIEVKSGLYFSSTDGSKGEFYSFEKWESLTSDQQTTLILEYKADNITIFNSVEDEIATLGATITAGSFKGAASAYEDGDIEGTFIDASTGEDVVIEKAPPTNEEIDAAVNAAQAAVNALEGVVITADNVEDVKAAVAEAKVLLAAALALDENVVFDTYPLEQAEQAIVDFEKLQITTAKIAIGNQIIDFTDLVGASGTLDLSALNPTDTATLATLNVNENSELTLEYKGVKKTVVLTKGANSLSAEDLIPGLSEGRSLTVAFLQGVSNGASSLEIATTLTDTSDESNEVTGTLTIKIPTN